MAESKGIKLHKETKLFNRKSKASGTITAMVVQGHKKGAPILKSWEQAQALGYTADMIACEGLTACIAKGAKGAIEYKKSVPRKNAKQANPVKSTKSKK